MAAGVLAVAAIPVAAASAATVSVRVEGATRTIVPTTLVDTAPGTFNVGGGGPCPAASVGGALQLATAGNWQGRLDPGQGQTVEIIGGEAYPIGAQFTGVFWSLNVEDRPMQTGACDSRAIPQTGDDILVYPACAGATTGCFAGPPLDFRAPPVVTPGVPFTVTVNEVVTTFPPPDFTQTTTVVPSAGATLSGPGVATATTDAAGHATLVLGAPGTVTVTATKSDRVREGVKICATGGSDGPCAAAAVPDRTAPRARLVSPRSGHVYRFAKFSPRVIRVAVDETGSGVQTVKLRLTRRVGDRCFSFSGKRDRFIGAKCGRGFFFKVSDRATVSFLLPERLPRGHYVLDAEAIDKSFNRDSVGDRGRNRSVFDVR